MSHPPNAQPTAVHPGPGLVSDLLDPITGHARRCSTRELQAAATAPDADRSPLARPGVAGGIGQRTPGPGADAGGVTVASLAGTMTTTRPLVRVWAGSTGAGASTVALALADAADGVGLRTRLLDAATPSWSGLVEASATELGATAGWRRGRRGRGVVIDRIEASIRTPDLVPRPRATEGIDLTVLDTGWTYRELRSATAAPAGCWVVDESADVEVLVTRATAQALGQAECLLSELAGTSVVTVVVGPARMSRTLVATAGPRLRRLLEPHAVVCVPRVSPRSLTGLGADPLPRRLLGAAHRLLEAVVSLTGPLAPHQS